MKAIRKMMRWMKVIEIVVRAELINIKVLKINKEDSVTVDDEFNS